MKYSSSTSTTRPNWGYRNNMKSFKTFNYQVIKQITSSWLLTDSKCQIRSFYYFFQFDLSTLATSRADKAEEADQLEDGIQGQKIVKLPDAEQLKWG